jgi:hypothetical protein
LKEEFHDAQGKTLSGAMLLLFICGLKNLPAQTCWLSVAGLNKNRFVWGTVNTECGWQEYGSNTKLTRGGVSRVLLKFRHIAAASRTSPTARMAMRPSPTMH